MDEKGISNAPGPRGDAALVRAVGFWGLVAAVVNITVGSGPDARALVSPLQAAVVEGFGTLVLVLVIFALTDPDNHAAPAPTLARDKGRRSASAGRPGRERPRIRRAPAPTPWA